MIVKKGHPLFGRTKLFGNLGAQLPTAFYFNTKTKRAGLYFPVFNGQNRCLNDGGKTVKVFLYLKDAKLIDKITGKEVL